MKTKILVSLALISIALLIVIMYKQFIDKKDGSVLFGNHKDFLNISTITAVGSSLIDKEDKLYLEIAAVNKQRANSEIMNAMLFMKVGSTNQKLDIKAATISTTAISNFTTVANGMSCVLPAAACHGTLTGIKIFYGLTSTGSFTLFYKPLKFCQESESYGQGGEYFGHYQVNEGSSYYYYDGSAFSVAQANTADEQIRNYAKATDGIQILRNFKTGSMSDFKTGNDFDGDVGSIVFSLQELLAVGKSTGNKGSIYLWNSVAEISRPNDWPLIKHILLASSDDISSTTNSTINMPIYGSELANLSHLCPPSCGNSYRYTYVLAHF